MMVIFSNFFGESLEVFMDDFCVFGDDFDSRMVTRQFRVVVEYTQIHIKTSSKLTNLKIKSLIKEISGE